jgi:type II secretory pathway component GspD/PulD (secretin)
MHRSVGEHPLRCAWHQVRRATILLGLLLSSAGSLQAQEAEMSAGPGAGGTSSPEASRPARPPTGTAQPVPGPGVPGTNPNAPQAKPGDGAGASPMPKQEERPTLRVRPATPPEPPNQEELTVRPDEDGLVQFSFQGQTWPDVLEWFAQVSQRTLDWQELPGDYLNLTVRRRYSLDEARDLLNRHLLARGFTLLEHGEGFSVVKIENLNPAMVPRVQAEDLDDHFPHEFVKVLFHLDWLLAEEVVKELETLKSPQGKLVALTTTNRLEAMDAVANLRDVHRVLQMEQSREGRQRLIREFTLVHVRAADVQTQLESFLGIERKDSAMPANMTPQQMAQMQQQAQMQAQAMAQAQAQRGGAAAASSPKTPEVRLTADNRRNTLIVHAPPDKMAIVESFIELIDVATGRADSLDAYLNRMKVYRLASLDPEQFVKSLEELGGLQPSTKVRPDTRNGAILVDASLVDHFTIKALIDKLDGSGRRFEVITLRRHAADEVAGSIEFLMGANQQEEKSNPRDRYYGYYPYGMGGQSQEDTKSRDKFRVGSNVESNQLLLWANEIELQEVEELLVKLGERPARVGNRQIRSLEIPLGDNPAAFLRDLERIWPSLAPNPLLLPRLLQPSDRSAPPAFEGAPSRSRSPADDGNSTDPPTPQLPALDRTERQGNFRSAIFTLTEEPAEPLHDGDDRDDGDDTSGVIPRNPVRPLSADSVEPVESEAVSPDADRLEALRRQLFREGTSGDQELPGRGTARTEAPPVQVGVGPDGKLIISSEDVAALELLERWLSQMVPQTKPFEVFRLKYASAYWVKLNLEDYFKEEKPDSSRDAFNSWYWGIPQPSRDTDKRQLGKRRPVRFISDYDTNTILVQGADRGQLEVIADLIELYDVPEPSSSQSMRVTKLFPIRYSRADVIAETIKDAYRDLLSSNDKALQAQQQQEGQRSSATIIRSFGPQASGPEEDREKQTQITFKGKLSIGVDEITNTLLVSTEGESLMNTIGHVIEALDQSAQKEAYMEVRELSSRMNGETLSKTLAKLLEQQRREAQQPSAPTPPPTPPPQPPVVVNGF